MKKQEIVIISVVGVVVVIIIWLIVYFTDRKKTFSWTETYREDSEQPFGTSVMSSLLKDYFPGNDFNVIKNDIATAITTSNGEHKTYVFIGEYPYYSDSVFNLLKDFVMKGNDAFLALKNLPEMLSAQILQHKYMPDTKQDTVYYLNEVGDSVYYLKDSYMEDPDVFSSFQSKNMSFNFYPTSFFRDSSWQYEIEIEESPVSYSWQYFYPNYLKTIADYQVIGSVYSENFYNFIRVPFGSGYFYIHCAPVAFSNYFQIEPQQLEYTSKVLSYLRPGDIIWDEASKTYTDDGQMNNDQQSAGPLNYILSQPSLRFAWYSLLTGLLLFIIFRGKRTQQFIPILEVNENRSLEFVQTIGRMYYLKKNHKQLAQQKMKLFLQYIVERYQLNAAVTDATFMKKLQMKSEISADGIQSIFNHYKYIENTNDVTDRDLIELHRLIDIFYKHCK